MIEFIVERAGNTFALIVEDVIVDFTTKYDEIDEMVEDYCEEHNIDTIDVLINEVN